MSDPNEKIDVPIDSELVASAEEPAVEVEIDGAEDGSGESKDYKKIVKKLQKKIEKERKLRESAEQQAKMASMQVNKAYNEVEDSNLQLVNSAIDTLNRDNEILKVNYREAMSIGDYDRAAEIQQAMSGNQAKLLQLENGKASMENKPRKPLVSDPVEQFAAQLSPRSAEWVRKNPQYVTDPRLNQKMIAAHQMAMADGLVADTDDYFEYVEETLRIKRKDKEKNRQDDIEGDDPMSKAAKPMSRSVPPPSAPVSKGGNNRPGVMTLTRAQADMAKSLGMTDKEYAMSLLNLKREGRIN